MTATQCCTTVIYIDTCVQIDRAARAAYILTDKGCASLLANIFVSLYHEHQLQFDVKGVLTRILYEVEHSHFATFLAQEVCCRYVGGHSPNLSEDILQDVLEDQLPEDYVRLPVMASRVAEFLTVISERYSTVTANS